MQRITLKPFGPIKDVEIDVNDLMIFIGPQASGKSTISKAIYFFKSPLERVPAGEEVIIGMQGKPVAKLVPYHRGHEPRQPGALRGRIIFRQDFDELPNDIAEAFGVQQP